MHSTTYPFRPVAPTRAETLLDRLWSASPPLTAVGTLMLFVAGVSLVGIFIDPRIITGVPAWLKPFKFASSTAITFVLEVGIIDMQAWRGTTSHFNASTMLDTLLFAVMGVAIFVQTAASVAVAVALWRQRFTDRPLGWALRLGMTLTIAGALTGPLMTRPTAEQLAKVRAGGGMTTVGAHTVGGADGGAGVPVTGWSRDHGDVRVPHFVGLHAIQVLALVALGLRRWRRPEAARVQAVMVLGASYAALFLLLTWQALRGQSVSAPDVVTLQALAAWAGATLVALGWISLGSRSASHGLSRRIA